MKLNEMTQDDEYAGYMSSPSQQDRMDKMWNGDGMKLVYMWVKQGVISYREFEELVTMYTKE